MAVFDIRGRLEAIAVAEAIATVRGQRDMGTVFPCGSQANGSNQIDLSTAIVLEFSSVSSPR